MDTFETFYNRRIGSCKLVFPNKWDIPDEKLEFFLKVQSTKGISYPYIELSSVVNESSEGLIRISREVYQRKGKERNNIYLRMPFSWAKHLERPSIVNLYGMGDLIGICNSLHGKIFKEFFGNMDYSGIEQKVV